MIVLTQREEEKRSTGGTCNILIHHFHKHRANVIIGGDIDHAVNNWDSCSKTKTSTATDHRYFLKFLLEKSLSQLVVTRPPHNSILDLITTTNSNLVNYIETHAGISDHFLVPLEICLTKK